MDCVRYWPSVDLISNVVDVVLAADRMAIRSYLAVAILESNQNAALPRREACHLKDAQVEGLCDRGVVSYGHRIRRSLEGQAKADES